MLIFLGFGALAVYGAFLRLERRGRSAAVVLILVGAVLCESLLYPSQNSVPGGIFHPPLGGIDIRLVDALLVLALTARIGARGFPQRIGRTGLAWTAFLAWVLAGAPVGLVEGYSLNQVIFQAKAVLYIGGGYALLSGVPVTSLVNRHALRVLVATAGIVTAIVLVLDVGRREVELSLPLLPEIRFGKAGADLATLLVIVGAVGLLVEATRRDRHILIGLSAVPLLLAPLVSLQRAAVLGLALTAIPSRSRA